MPKVSVKVGCTIKLGDPMQQFGNYARMDFEVSDIDTERDLQEQLETSSTAIKSAFDYLMRKMNHEIDKQLDAKL